MDDWENPNTPKGMAEDVIMDRIQNAFFALFAKVKGESLPPKIGYNDYYGKCNGIVGGEETNKGTSLRLTRFRILEVK